MVQFLDPWQNIENLPNETRIIGGDFNLVLNLELDKKGGHDRTNFKSKAITGVNKKNKQTFGGCKIQMAKNLHGTGKTLLKHSVTLIFLYHLV